MLESIQTLFNWLNGILAAVPFASAKGIVTAFLVLAVLGIFMFDRNTALRSAPEQHWRFDLRLWASAIMTPYILIYLIF